MAEQGSAMLVSGSRSGAEPEHRLQGGLGGGGKNTYLQVVIEFSDDIFKHPALALIRSLGYQLPVMTY